MMTLAYRLKLSVLALLAAVLATLLPALISYRVARGDVSKFCEVYIVRPDGTSYCGPISGMSTSDRLLVDAWGGIPAELDTNKGDRLAVYPHNDAQPIKGELVAVASTGDVTLGSAAPSDAGSASAPAAAPAPASSAPPPAPPQASDVAVATKLYKNGSFFGLGIIALYVGLFVWFKVDKKRAFYAATSLGAVGLVVESIRRGDTPNAAMLLNTLGPAVGIMIHGPGHAKAPPIS